MIDHIESCDALGELNRNNYILNAYGNCGGILSRLPRQFDDSFETFWKYYNKRVATMELDSISATTTLQVRSFTSQDAIKINESLLELSEHLANRMNECVARDMVQLARGEVDTAAAKAKDVAVVLATHRKSNAVSDPDRQSALQLQQVTML